MVTEGNDPMDTKKVLKLKKLNPEALKETVAAAKLGQSSTPTAAPKPYYSSY